MHHLQYRCKKDLYHARSFTDEDYIATDIIREIRATFGCVSPVESIVAYYIQV